MIFDCHAYLGHYPFRPLRYNTGAGLVELMDRPESAEGTAAAESKS